MSGRDAGAGKTISHSKRKVSHQSKSQAEKSVVCKPRLTLSCASRLFCERLNQVEVKLEEVQAEEAREYREPLAALENSKQTRTQVASAGFLSCLTAIYFNS